MSVRNGHKFWSDICPFRTDICSFGIDICPFRTDINSDLTYNNILGYSLISYLSKQYNHYNAYLILILLALFYTWNNYLMKIKWLGIIHMSVACIDSFAITSNQSAISVHPWRNDVISCTFANSEYSIHCIYVSCINPVTV